MIEFTPMLCVSGGFLIGLSAKPYLSFGCILGISGIIAHTLNFYFVPGPWRPFFNRFSGIACSGIDGFAIAA